MAEIDSLQIEITTKAKQVDDTIDVLVKKLDLLSGSLKNINKINTSGLKKVANNFNNINKTTSSMASGLSRVSTSAQKTTKSFGGLASSIGKFYATWFGVIRGIKALGRSIEASADYVEAFNYYTVSFGKVASKWDKDWSTYGDENARNYSNAFVTELNSTFEKLSGVSFNPETGLLSETGLKNLGLNLREVTEYAAQLGSMMDSVGHSGQTTLATTQAFVKLAADMSSLRNIDYSTAGSKIRSVLQGQSRAGYEFGWDTTMASLQSMADRLDLSKAVSEMTQMEKQQLRILVILEQSRVAWGDQANTINTFANQTRILRNNMSELSMMLGQLFIPILDKIMPIVNGITIAIKNLLSSIAGFFGLEIKDTGFGFSGIEDDVDGVTDSLDQATESAKKLRKQLQGFDKLNVITSPTDSGASSGGGVGGGIDLTDEILEATEEYEKVWQEAFDRMENRAEEFSKKVEKALAPVKSLFQNIAIGDWFAVGQDVTTIVVGITDFFTRAIENTDWEYIGEQIGLYLKGLDWSEIIRSGFELKFNIFEAIADVWFESFNTAPIETAIITGLAAMKFTGLGKKMAEAKLGSKIIGAIATALGIEGVNLTIPITLAIAAVAFGYEVGGEIEEIEKNVKKYGDKGRGMSGDGWIDNVALAQYDIQNANDAITMSYADTGRKQKEFFEDWGSKIKTSQKDIQSSNDAITMSYADMASNANDKIKDFFEDWGSKIETHNTNVSDANLEINQAYIDMFEEIATNIATWWEEDVSPWFTKEKWEELGNNMKTSLTTKWEEFNVWWETTGIPDWWNENVIPWFTREKWKTLGQNMKKGLEDKWKEFSNWWETTGIYKWYKDNVEPWFSKDTWNFDGIKDGLSKAFNNAINSLKGIWNSFAKWVNNALSFEFAGLSKSFEVLGKKITIGLPKFSISLGKLPTFKTYQTGGFPEDGFFFANHNELVGQFANGKTAVANNEQIVAGIERGVRDANSEQNALLREQNALLRQILAKDTGISTRDVFEAVRTENREYINRNGESAFAF